MADVKMIFDAVLKAHSTHTRHINQHPRSRLDVINYLRQSTLRHSTQH